MTLLGSPSNALYLFFRGELCAVKHSAMLGIYTLFSSIDAAIFFMLELAVSKKCMLTWSFPCRQCKRSVFFSENNYTRKGQWLFWPFLVGHFIHIDNGKKAMQYLCAGIESLEKMWCDVIREWMKLIQKKNHQNTFKQSTSQNVIPLFLFIINIYFLSDFFLKSK